MNKEKKVTSLIERLNAQIHRDGDKTLSVSPTQKLSEGREKSLSSDFPLLTPFTRLEDMENNMLYLVHAMLHKFYGEKRNRYLTREDIKTLHTKVRLLIVHRKFDSLDNDK